MSITIHGKELSINIPLTSKQFVALIEEYEQSNKEMVQQGHDPKVYGEPSWDGLINYIIAHYDVIEYDTSKFGLVIPMFAV